MIEIALAIVACFVIIWFVATMIGGLVVGAPVILLFLAGHAFGLAWWQSLLIGLLGAGVVMAAVERNREKRFKQRAQEFGLSPEDLGRQVEIEGKLHTIKGMSGDKIVAEARGALGRKIDPRLIAQKLKP